MKSKLFKMIAIIVGLAELGVLFLPYLANGKEKYNSLKVIQIAFEHAGNEWGYEYLLDFVLPVGISVIGLLIFMAKSKVGTAVTATIFDVLAAALYIFVNGILNKRGVDVQIGFKLNMVLVFVEIVLLIAFIVAFVKEKKAE